jgi:type IV pilus assembly protein PilB
MNFTDVLIKKNAISQEELSEITAKAKEKGASLEKMLSVYGVSDTEITKAKSESLGIPFKEIKAKDIPFDLLKQVPEESARHYKFIPIGMENGVLQIGMVDPGNIEAREAVQFIVTKFDTPFEIFLISEEDFNSILEEYKGLSGEVTKVLGELESALLETEKIVSQEEGLEKKAKFTEDAPVTKMVAVIIKHAIAGNASDIHIEPLRDKLKVRFRVDGILYTSLLLPATVHEAIASRIKILTNMRLDEKRKPQDGRFGAHIEGREIDFRVSTLPTFFGEKIAIRILDVKKGVKNLEETGISKRNLDLIRENIKKAYGLILLTGPTGSGKTTTLYAMLQELDKEKENVISLEDPVEYNVAGINQSQVKPEIGYDFANGLRSILRQDPDIIMVGEIRDKETASLAIQAALTGHLVFSTIHTNSAVGVIPRLIDMGVDPFLIAPTLLMAMSQRLVRTLCPDSKKPIPLTSSLRTRMEKELENIQPELRKNLKIPENVFEGIPSASCPQGAKGRMAISEAFVKTPELENIILTNPVEQEILKEARRQGMITVREEGVLKIFEGVIGAEELDKL